MPVRAFLVRHGWLIAIVAAYLYVFPYYPRIHSANELPRVLLVRAIVEDHTFAIDRGLRGMPALADVSPSGGHQYSNKAPGSSLLVVPFYAAVRWFGDPGLAGTMWLCRIVAGVIPMALFLVLLSRFLARFSDAPEVRRLVLVAYALGSMAMTYSLLYFSHQLAAICIASAWIFAEDVLARRRGLGWMAVVGVLAGAAPLVDYQAAFAGVPLAVYLIARMWRWPRPRGELARALAVAGLAAAVPVAILLGYHAACFGSPWRTGYDASETFAGYHQQGFLGITTLRAEAFWGSLFSLNKGLFALAPWWLLAIPGAVVLWRRGERALVAVLVAIAVVFVLFVSSINFWRGGWSVGPRYITAMLPFLLPLAVAAVDAWRPRRVLIAVATGAMAAAFAIYVLSTATLPYWPEWLRDPLYEVTFRLVRDGAFAPSLGSACGVSGLVGALPFLAICAGLAGWAIVRVVGVRGLVVAAALAAALLAAYGLAPHGGPEADRAYVQTLYPAVAR